MSPSDIETSARQSYNAVGDTFFPAANIYNWIYQAQMILARKAWIIEGTDSSTSTVNGTQAYTFPTAAHAVHRIEVNSRKLKVISQRQDDAVTLGNTASLQSGQPAYYFIWNRQVYLRPVPDSAYTIKYYYYGLPGAVSASSTLDVSAEYHMDIVDYVLWRMFAQDQNAEMAAFYKGEWEAHVREAVSTRRRAKRADSLGETMSEDVLPTTVLGAI